MSAEQRKKYKALAKFVIDRAADELGDIPITDHRHLAPALLLHMATVDYFLALLEYVEAATSVQARAMRMQEPYRFAARLSTIAQRWAAHPDYNEDWTP